MNKNKKYRHHIAVWGVLFFLCATAVGFAIFVIIYVLGIKNIQIYLNSSFKYQFFLVLFIPGIFILFCLCILIFAAVKIISSAPRSPCLGVRIASILSAVIFLTGSCLLLYDHHLRVHGDKPSAAKRFWARIGPIVQFGPFDDRRAAYGGIVIWYFDPFIKNNPRFINYGTKPTPESMGQAVEAAGPEGKRHEFHLTGLKAATLYYYQIPDWGEKIYSFRTAPLEDSAGPFRFVCIGDTGDTIRGGYNFSYYRDVMRAAKKFYTDQMSAPSFVIHAGDVVRTGIDLDAWHQHFSSNDNSTFPTMMTPGNHEFLEDRGGNYRYFFHLPDYYTFDYANAVILSIHPFDGPGTGLDGPVLSTGVDQYRFIQKELERANGKKWKIVVIHIPVMATGDYGTSEILAAQYLELFRKYKVDIVLSGHNHNFESFHVDRDEDWGGTLYVIAGTGGSKLDSYIMTRKKRRWKAWYHDPLTVHGLYQKDLYAERYFDYGELSWGFTDMEINGDTMTVSYYRWLDIESFLKITRQNRSEWEMVPIDERTIKANNLSAVTLVKKFVKIKK